MKQTIIIAIILLVTIQLASCQSKRKNMIEKFEWEEGKAAPLEYPIEVYRGGFSNKQGGFTSLYGGLTTGQGYWGYPDNGMTSGKHSLPDHIHVQWLSFAEDAIFEVDADIDQEKIASYFRKGFKRRGASGKIRHEEYTQVVAGFAPGGVVVIWVSGPGNQKEIGRYKGKKIEIPQSEIEALDYPDKTLFEEDYRQKVLKDPSIIPLEVQERIKDKPIPYGLWDTYRIQYHWKPIFQIQNNGTMGDYGFSYLNGESDKKFSENNIQNENNKELFYQDVKDSITHPIPREVSFNWVTKQGVRHAGYFKFNDTEILNAFQKVTKENENLQMELLIRVNTSNNYASVLLRGSNGEEVWIKEHDKTNFFEMHKNKR